MRFSVCDTVVRFCARPVLCWLAFPSAPALRSTGSAAVETALFVGFPATMAESDFSRPYIIGYGSSPSRCGPAALPNGRSRDLPVPAQGASAHARVSDHAGSSWPRDVAPGHVAFHLMHGVGTQNETLSRLNGWPMRSPVNASPKPSRAPAHDSGSMWIATPSSQGTCTLYSLPVSRRFAYVFRFAPESGLQVCALMSAGPYRAALIRCTTPTPTRCLAAI